MLLHVAIGRWGLLSIAAILTVCTLLLLVLLLRLAIGGGDTGVLHLLVELLVLAVLPLLLLSLSLLVVELLRWLTIAISLSLWLLGVLGIARTGIHTLLLL